MKITSCLCEGSYDFEIEHKEYRPNNESTFGILIGSTTLTLSREEWLRIHEMVERSMSFLDLNHHIEA